MTTEKELEIIANNRAQLEEFIDNVLSLRRKYWNDLLDERRDIDDECGYPAINELTITHYRKLYDREPVPNRIVNLFPDESWVGSPSVYEDEDPEITTQFEEDFTELGKSLHGESFYESEDSNTLWEYLHRIDRLSGIGSFGVLLIGTDHEIPEEFSSNPLAFPLPLNSKGKTNNVTYLRCFDESLCRILRRETDPTSPRYMRPVLYELDFEVVEQAGVTADTSSGKSVESRQVHWTRIIHVADTLESSEIFAIPRIRPNYNRCYDIRKVSGGSGEMYWRGALPPIFLKAYKELGSKVKLSSDTKDAMEQLMNTLQRWAFAPGIEPVQLAPTVVDPTRQIDVYLDSICIQLSCPKRIFVGSERGELASSQDQKAWNKRMVSRQNRYIIPRLIVPFIDRLILTGCLTPPAQYTVKFPDLNALSEKEKAEIGFINVQSLVKYIQGGGNQVVSEIDFLTSEKFLAMDNDEAEGIVDRALEQLEETQAEEEKIFEESQKALEKLVPTRDSSLRGLPNKKLTSPPPPPKKTVKGAT